MLYHIPILPAKREEMLYPVPAKRSPEEMLYPVPAKREEMLYPVPAKRNAEVFSIDFAA